jgi:hypothetical protein
MLDQVAALSGFLPVAPGSAHFAERCFAADDISQHGQRAQRDAMSLKIAESAAIGK